MHLFPKLLRDASRLSLSCLNISCRIEEIRQGLRFSLAEDRAVTVTTVVLRVYRLRVALRKPFLPDVQCVDDDFACTSYIRKEKRRRAREAD